MRKGNTRIGIREEPSKVLEPLERHLGQDPTSAKGEPSFSGAGRVGDDR